MDLLQAINTAQIIDKFFNRIQNDNLSQEDKVESLKILISKPYYSSQYSQLLAIRKQNPEWIFKLFFDCGSYTMNLRKGNAPLPLPRRNEYRQTVMDAYDLFDNIANYDENFFDVPRNQENMLILMDTFKDKPDYKKKIVPVVHAFGEDAVKEFILYVEMGFELIAIGSQPEVDDITWGKIRDYQRQINRERESKIKIHLFGVGSFKRLKRLMPDSADCSNFAQKSMQGGIYYWDKERINTKENPLISVRVLESTNPDGKDSGEEFGDKHAKCIKDTFNFEYVDLIKDYSKREVVNIYALCQMEKYLTSLEQK